MKILNIAKNVKNKSNSASIYRTGLLRVFSFLFLFLSFLFINLENTHAYSRVCAPPDTSLCQQNTDVYQNAVIRYNQRNRIHLTPGPIEEKKELLGKYITKFMPCPSGGTIWLRKKEDIIKDKEKLLKNKDIPETIITCSVHGNKYSARDIEKPGNIDQYPLKMRIEMTERTLDSLMYIALMSAVVLMVFRRNRQSMFSLHFFSTILIATAGFYFFLTLISVALNTQMQEQYLFPDPWHYETSERIDNASMAAVVFGFLMCGIQSLIIRGKSRINPLFKLSQVFKYFLGLIGFIILDGMLYPHGPYGPMTVYYYGMAFSAIILFKAAVCYSDNKAAPAIN